MDVQGTVLEGDLDEWWSQKALFKPDADYREEFRKIRQDLALADGMKGCPETDLEVCGSKLIDGVVLSPPKDNRSLKIINDLIARVLVKGCKPQHFPTFFPSYFGEGSLETGQAEGAPMAGNGRSDIVESNLEEPEGTRINIVNQKKPVKEDGLANILRIGELGEDKEPFEATDPGEHIRRNFHHKSWKVKKTKLHLTLGQDIGLMEEKTYFIRGLVGRFGYRIMYVKEIDRCVMDRWGPVLGYTPVVYIICKG